MFQMWYKVETYSSKTPLNEMVIGDETNIFYKPKATTENMKSANWSKHDITLVYQYTI